MNNDEQIMLALSKLSQGIASIQSDLASVKEDVASLAGDLEFVRASVVKIEYEHGAKLQALIDRQVAMEEKLSGHEQRIVKLEHASDQHDAKISSLLKKAL